MICVHVYREAEKQKEVASLEAWAYKLIEMLSEQRSSTRDNIQRKQARTGKPTQLVAQTLSADSWRAQLEVKAYNSFTFCTLGLDIVFPFFSRIGHLAGSIPAIGFGFDESLCPPLKPVLILGGLLSVVILIAFTLNEYDSSVVTCHDNVHVNDSWAC